MTFEEINGFSFGEFLRKCADAGVDMEEVVEDQKRGDQDGETVQRDMEA